MDDELRINTFSGTWFKGPQQPKHVVTLPLTFDRLYESRTFDIGDQDQWGFVLSETGPLILDACVLGYRWLKLQFEKRAVWIHSSEIFEGFLEQGCAAVLVHTDDIGLDVLSEWQQTQLGVHLLDVQIVLRD